MSHPALPHLKHPSPAQQKIDRLPWTHGIAFALYGARIGVRSNDAAALDALVPFFPPGWRIQTTTTVDWLLSLRVGTGKRRSYVLYSNAERFPVRHKWERACEEFEREAQLAVAQTARGMLFVHAGVVARHGRALLIPGKSYSGKSTLVRALVRAGATYYSDEYAVLDARGRVHPFARPLALRDENYRNRKMPFDELGGAVGRRPLPVAVIVAANYRADATWRPRRLTPGAGVLELLAHTVTARARHKEALRTLARVMANATIWKGTRGEADALAPRLLDALDTNYF